MDWLWYLCYLLVIGEYVWVCVLDGCYCCCVVEFGRGIW